ncbi:YqhV family protein [Paenibacillus apiarius]|uniref:YqhV family protein n=1 Tax=Paenibacillus apiarius TaxID=46240 RepID=A0ABT4DNI7_9BACL|nr:YqhV family protein [Paenibacillus apiarius]MCY9517328.1 YqhV family protein [Paenibacillus apiarius]MCY9518801.1 YqhV family protein [Paenibacillus apiarius]MCY9552758.1 YqhV family protein [Paenibacillus apiarius]MCY9556783.1 YqhV family protein [Paenibacillus apiarius]MCY9684318.1 YqhV family protein [Paenibacillus apiarius]
MSIDKFVASMAGLRVMSGCLEITAAIIMLRLNQPERALAVNSLLALVGPLVLIATTTIGLIGMADKLNWNKIAWIVVGVTCLLIGILKK